MRSYCNCILTVSLYSFLLQKFTSHSKLSATVPAFVPGEVYTGPTFSSSLVINSNLSPLVPEFKPSVSFTSYAPPYKPGHHFQYPYHQSYIKQGNIEWQQVSHQDLYESIYLHGRVWQAWRPSFSFSFFSKNRFLCLIRVIVIFLSIKSPWKKVKYHNSHEQLITLKYRFPVVFSFLMHFLFFVSLFAWSEKNDCLWASSQVISEPNPMCTGAIFGVNTN